jgi:FAD/FMN-containing dehydrogenase
MSAARQPVPDLVARLAHAIPADRVVTGAKTLAELARDQLRSRRAFPNQPPADLLPLVAVRPESTDEVVAVVRLAAETGTPLVQFGGGTGLMGGAATVRPGIVVDMQRMNRVLRVSPEDRLATVQSGTVLGDLGSALETHGLILGHDPWTVPIATVGGTISTNSLGYRAGKYGSMGDQVLGLEAVLADGSVIRTRAVPRSSTGPRLHHLFIGAEGAFGVITEATLRAFPAPERRELLAFDTPSFMHGFDAAQELMAIGLTPAMLDFGAPPRESGRLYLGFEGLAEEVTAQSARARQVCAGHRATALDSSVAQGFWDDRHVEPQQLRSWRRAEREQPRPGEPGSAVFDYLHVALPASAVPRYIERTEAALAAREVQVREWGLWHGPELLSLVIYRRTDSPSDLQQAVTAVDETLMLAQDLGGSMEYVHGAGLRYAHLMAREHGAGLDLLRALKHAADPLDILNPGKMGL